MELECSLCYRIALIVDIERLTSPWYDLSRWAQYTQLSSGDLETHITLVDWFAGDASMSIDILISNGFRVCVGDPGHFTFAGTHIRGWHINAWPYETLFCQFQCKASGDLLQFMFGVFFWIQLQTGLGASKRYIDASTFELCVCVCVRSLQKQQQNNNKRQRFYYSTIFHTDWR